MRMKTNCVYIQSQRYRCSGISVSGDKNNDSFLYCWFRPSLPPTLIFILCSSSHFNQPFKVTSFSLMKRRQMYFKKKTSFQVNKVLLLFLCYHSLPCKQLVFSLWWRRLKSAKFKTSGKSISTDVHRTRSPFSQLELDLTRVCLSKVLNEKKQRISPREYMFPM